MRFSGARLTVEKQDAFRRVIAASRRDRRQQIVELLPGLGVNFRHVDRIGAPEIILPGNRMLERLAQLVGSERGSKRRLFEWTAFNAHCEPECLLILDAHKMPDGVLVEDLRILKRFQVAAVLEIGGREFDLTRTVGFREHAFEGNLG